jgi:hypothetical protein
MKQDDGWIFHPDHDPQRYELLRIGISREQRFIHAWRHYSDPILGFVSVREANHDEDMYEGVDAFLKQEDGTEIPIQIKGTAMSAMEFREERDPDTKGIVVMIIRDTYEPQRVIWETLRSIDLFRRRTLVHEERQKPLRFLYAWNNLLQPPDWYRSVRESTPEERGKGIDAYLKRIDEYELPIRVVGSAKEARRTVRESNCDAQGEVITVIWPDSTPDDVVSSTLYRMDLMKIRQDQALKRVGYLRKRP